MNSLVVGNIITIDGKRYNVESVKTDKDGWIQVNLILLPVIEYINITCKVVE